MKNRELAFVDLLAPYYVASIGAHCFNVMNQKRKIFYVGMRIPQIRMHNMWIALPGAGKTEFLLQFVRGRQAIVDPISDDTILGNTIDNGFEQSLTEAGLIGTIHERKGIDGSVEVVWSPGAVTDYEDGIVGCEEFQGIISAMRADWNPTLESVLLSVLDRGEAVKRLGRMGQMPSVSGHHSAMIATRMTLFAGCQPTVYNLNSGLVRRLFFIFFPLTPTQDAVIRSAQTKRRNLRVKWDEVKNIRELTDRLRKDLWEKLQKIEFPAGYQQFLRENNIIGPDTHLFDAFLIGYNVVTKPITDVLNLEIDDRFRTLAKRASLWRDVAKIGPMKGLVYEWVKDLKVIPKWKLVEKLERSYAARKEVEEAIRWLENERKIKQLNGVLEVAQEWL